MSVSMDDRTLLGSLKKAVELLGDRPLVRFTDGETHSASALMNGAAAFGAVLLKQGVNAGDRVAILCTNRVEFIWSFFGVCWIGAIPAPLNTSLHGEILRNMIEDLDPNLIVCERETELAVRKATGSISEKLFVLDIDASSEIDRIRDGRQRFELPEQHQSASSDLAMILYTSGTTGRSKGIMYSHEMAITFSEATHWMLGYSSEDVAFNCLPLFHGNSLLCTLVPAMRVGALSVFAPRFSANTFWETVRAEGATVLSLLGSMVPILMNQPPSPNDNASRARIALAVPAPGKSFFQFQERFNLKLSSLYGMTDIGLPIGVPADIPGRPGMCGILHTDWECMIADESDRPLPDGEIGEMLIRPRRPYIMQLGYWRNPTATAETWRNLWFHTGDYLRRDSSGWFEFIDRKKDAIRRFGENISSFEVETVLLGHNAIAEAAVYAVPADLEEDEVMASIVLEPGKHVTAPEMLEYCTENLPYFAVPRYIRITPALPKTQTAKVQKQELRRIAIDELSWDAGPRGRRKRS
jgi:crotonobetaine/carnitine-CoA ligase